jgi:hypothetical protein
MGNSTADSGISIVEDQELDRTVRICRSYLQQTRQHQSMPDIADSTGFATPSVLERLSRKERSPEAL